MNIGGVAVILNSLNQDILVKNLQGQQLFVLANGMIQLQDVFRSLAEEENETTIGTSGDDRIVGAGGSDHILGLGGSDNIEGRGGDDELHGGDGRDFVFGGAGNDVVSGGAGNDNLFGSGGNDRLSGGDGNDTLAGGKGRDVLDGGAGADKLIGHGGNDTFIISNNGTGEADTIIGFNPNGDILNLSAFVTDSVSYSREDVSLTKTGDKTYVVKLDDPLSSTDISAVTIRMDDSAAEVFLDEARIVFNDLQGAIAAIGDVIGGPGADELLGLGGSNLLKGLGGNDRLDGGKGGDRILGGGGNDQMSGGAGGDTMKGGAGADFIDGGAGADKLIGGGGKDVLISGAGKDVLKGGGGDDTLVGGAGNNRLVGGKGHDTFMFNSDTLKKGHNTIVDFDPDEDTLMLDGVELNFSAAEFTITDNQIRVGVSGDSGAGGWFQVEAWDGLFDG